VVGHGRLPDIAAIRELAGAELLGPRETTQDGQPRRVGRPLQEQGVRVADPLHPPILTDVDTYGNISASISFDAVGGSPNAGTVRRRVMTAEAIHAEVRARYAQAAIQATEGSCCSGQDQEIGPALYSALERSELPPAAVLASLGCGNPIAVAELHEGERVLDLGSGGGIDVLLSARRVGPNGRAIGLDMTDEMLALAQRNAAEAGVANVEFLKGHIEAIPLPAESVDVVISNCVINLAADKPAVFREIARVLRPGGRMGVTDIVAADRLTPEQRADRGSYTGCIAGALSFSEFRAGLEAAGLTDISLTPTHDVADGMVSAIVKATKPLDARPTAEQSGRRVLPVADAGGCCGGTGCG
jgi:arsenite methyltransferase